MKRREFSSGLLAAGLAAPPVLGPTSAFANVKEEDGTRGGTLRSDAVDPRPRNTVAITWLSVHVPALFWA